MGERLAGERLASERRRVSDDAVALFELSRREGWGDGLPVLPPTEARVLALIDAQPRPADHVVAVLAPENRVLTVELAAVNAAMAGVEPGAFAYVLAALRAMAEPAHNLYGLTTTTSSAVSALIVNGPRRDEFAFDYGSGCTGGAGGRGSLTVGRAVQLCLRNVGGQRIGVTSKSVFGQPARVSGLCFAEWEERSPWPTLAERRGYDARDEVVSCHGSKGTLPFADGNTRDERDLLDLIARTISFPLSNMFHGSAGRGECVLLINPLWADRFGRAFPTIEGLQSYLLDRCWLPIETWPRDNWPILESKGRVDDRGRVALAAAPEQFILVVCGGLGNLHGLCLPSWGDSKMVSATVER